MHWCIGQQQKADNISGLLGEASFKSRMKAFGTKSVDGFVLRIGIDDFSDINERFGVEYGDRILKTVADDISSQLTNLINAAIKKCGLPSDSLSTFPRQLIQTGTHSLFSQRYCMLCLSRSPRAASSSSTFNDYQ